MKHAIASAAPRGLAGVLVALGLATALHATQLPPWATLLIVAALGWRWTAARRSRPLGFLCLVNRERDRPQLPTDAERLAFEARRLVPPA